MYGFVTSTFIGGLLALIGIHYEASSLLILVLVSTCCAFISHGENLPLALRSSAWFLGMGLGILAIINAVIILL